MGPKSAHMGPKHKMFSFGFGHTIYPLQCCHKFNGPIPIPQFTWHLGYLLTQAGVVRVALAGGTQEEVGTLTLAHWVHAERSGENRRGVARGGARVQFNVPGLHHD